MIRSFVLIIIITLSMDLPLRAQSPSTGNGHARTDADLIDQQVKFAENYFNKKDRNPADLDSAISKLHQALVLSIRRHLPASQNKLLGLLAADSRQLTDLEKKRNEPLILLGYYHTTGNPYKEAGSWQQLGDSSDDFIFENFCYEKAQNLYLGSGHKLEAISALKAVGDNFLRAGDYGSAEDTLSLVLHRYQLAGYKKLFFTYDLLAAVNSFKGLPDKELFYHQAAVKNMEETGDYQYAATYYHSLATTYHTIHNYEQSLVYEKKALAFRKADFYLSLNFIAINLEHLKRPGDAIDFIAKEVKLHPSTSKKDSILLCLTYGGVYAALKKYQTAEKYYVAAIADYKFTVDKNTKSNDAVDKQYDASVFENVVRFYILTKQYHKAKNTFDRIPFDINTTLLPQYLIAFNLLQFKIDSALGNYVSAIRHFQVYKKLNDSVFSAKNVNTVQEMQIQYLTNDKKQSLRVQSSERNIQNMRVQRADVQRNVTLAGVGLALIIAGFSYKGYRRKQLSALLISKKNHQLQLLLQEKDWLLKEVHHRVKNNLHTVFCLLESQTQYLQGDALTAVESSQRRIYAMSLLHQRLYQSKDIQVIDMAVYLPELLTYLKDSFGSPDHIVFCKLIAPVKLTVAQAIPLALIINEAATNAIKYAFPKDQPGKLFVSLDEADNRVTLVIEDNGVGIPEDTDFKNLNSMGLELMRGLSIDLQGDIRFIIEHGTKVVVTFTLLQGTAA